LADKTIDSVVVIGLGRFGGHIATSLAQLGHEVLGVDFDMRVVEAWSDQLTHVAQVDATDDEALRQLGVAEFGHAAVGIGRNIEASVLTVVALTDLKVPEIWARAASAKHGKILTGVGAHHVIFPEAAMGERIAHLITSRMLDYVDFEDGFAVAKVRAPTFVVDRTLNDSMLRTEYGITVVGVRMPGQDFTYALAEMAVPAGALLVVAGTAEAVQAFAATT
jgi:trk system potassium uptake protein TrkA